VSTDVVVHATADLLAKAAAARLVTRLVDAQAARGVVSIVLTGGRVGGAVLRELRDNPARDAVDWARVNIWWGDERWLPDGDPERNDKQARDALLSAVPVDPARVHPFPAADGPYAGNPEAAAAAYAAELAAATRPEDHGPVPRMDVLMLGVGEEGHVASIFPESPAAYETRPVVAVRGCPKPPPTRLTLTFPAIAAATDVWLMAAGSAKASAIAIALGGAGAIQVPAAGVHGRARTLWLLDRESAAKLPPSVLRLPIG
jgi:6-phosphogluconolactonase